MADKIEWKQWPGPVPAGANTVRPWWRLQQVKARIQTADAAQNMRFCFVRSDGLTSSSFRGEARTGPSGGTNIVWPASVLDELALLDEHSPMDAPTPTPMQVFMAVEGKKLCFIMMRDVTYDAEKQEWDVEWNRAEHKFTAEQWADYLRDHNLAVVSGWGHPWAPPTFVRLWSSR